MLHSIISALQKKKKLILIHSNADPDALGSAYAIQCAFPAADIVSPGGLDRASKAMAEKLKISVRESAEPDDYQAVIILDTSSPAQLGWDKEIPPGSVIIDHHNPLPSSWKNCIYYCDESKRSCAEIVYQLIKSAGKTLDRSSGLALMVGMLTDSGHFRYATKDLLESFTDLLDLCKAEIDEVFGLTEIEPDISERIAQLKGAQRMKFEKVGEFIVGISHTSSFESSVCKSLITIGVDIAFVGSQRDERFRISARTRQELVRRGLHLGKMLEEIGNETNTAGGGHAAAAGLTGEGDVKAILHICMQRAIDFLLENK